MAHAQGHDAAAASTTPRRSGGVNPRRAAIDAFSCFRRHHMTDHAAALTFYMVMALFPGLLVAISLYGLVASPSSVVDTTRYLRDIGAPESTVSAVHDALANLVETSSGKAGLALALGLLIGINSASSAFGAAGRALNRVHDIDEDRGFVRRKIVDVGFTLLLILLAIVSLAAVLLGGEVAHDLLGTIGLGDTGATIFAIVRWPIALMAIIISFGIIYAFAPDLEPEQRRFRWISPGSAVGAAIWLLGSLAFFFYVANLGSYGATYGAFAGAVILLLWLYVSAVAFLYGGELNAEIARTETNGRA